MRRFLALILLAVALVALPGVAVATAPDSLRQEVAISEPMVSSQRGVIQISCPVNGKAYTFQIYAITGQLLKKVQLTDTSTTIAIPQGCYIVKCECWVKKVIVP